MHRWIAALVKQKSGVGTTFALILAAKAKTMEKDRMRFAAYFEAAAQLCERDPAQAERLIREAEAHSLVSVPEHLNLCARFWMECLRNRDNAMRCLLLNECRIAPNDQEGLLEITEAYLVIVRDFTSAERCFKKALAASAPAKSERLNEFLAKYGRKNENGDTLCLGSTNL